MSKEPKLKTLPMEQVIPTPQNPRRELALNDPGLLELAASIKSHGLLHPVVCRPHPSREGCYDLRCGRRRYQAHQINKSAHILAIVREMSDQQAVEATALENLEREDLTPLEEGLSVQMMLDAGRDAEAIAADIGKSKSWVYRRANLTNLSEAWRAVIDDPEHFAGKWSAAHLENVARFDVAVQDRILKAAQREWYLPAGVTVARMREYLDAYQMDLSAMPWPFDDADLVAAAGSCAKCMKRRLAVPDLFTEEEQVEGDSCLDPKCFKKKQAAFFTRREKELREKHGEELLVIKTTYGQGGSREALSPHEYTEAKKSDRKSKPAIVCDGKELGALKWVISNRPQPSGEADKPRTAEVIAAEQAMVDANRRKAEREAFIERKLVERLDDVDNVPASLMNPKGMLLVLAAFSGGMDKAQEPSIGLYEALRDGHEDALLRQAWAVLSDVVQEGVLYRATPEEVTLLCELVDLDVAALQRAALEAHPEPEPDEACAKCSHPKSLHYEGTGACKHEFAGKKGDYCACEQFASAGDLAKEAKAKATKKGKKKK